MPDDTNGSEGDLREFFDAGRAAEIAARWSLLATAWSTLTGRPLPGEISRPARSIAVAQQGSFVPSNVTPAPVSAAPAQPAAGSMAGPKPAPPHPVVDTEEAQSLEALFGRLRKS